MAWLGTARRVLRRIAIGVGALFLVTAFVLVWAFKTGRAVQLARKEVITELRDLCGVHAEFSSLALGVFPPELALTGLELRHLDGRKILSVEEAIVSVRVLPLFIRRLQLDRVAVLAPEATIDLENGRILNLPRCVEPPAKGPTTPDAPAFPIALGIQELTVERGRFDLVVKAANRSFSAKLEGIGVTLASRSSGGTQIAVGVDDGSLSFDGGTELPLRRFRLLGHLAGLLTAPRALVFDRAEVGFSNVDLVATGSIDLVGPVVEARVELGFPLAAIREFVPDFPVSEGQATLKVSLAGTPVEPRATGQVIVVAGKIGAYGLGDQIRLDFRVDRLGLEIAGLEMKLHDGKVAGTGRVEFDEALSAHFEAEVANLSFGRTFESLGTKGSWVDFLASGPLTLAGSIRKADLRGTLDFQLGEFRVFDRAWDSVEDRRTLLALPPASVTGNWSVDKEGVNISDANLATGGSSGVASARLHYANLAGLRVIYDLSNLDFFDLGPIAGLEVEGFGVVRGKLEGPYGDPRVVGSVDLDDVALNGIALGSFSSNALWHGEQLDFQGIDGKLGATKYSGAAEIEFRGDIPLRISGKIESGRIEDVLVPFGVEAASWGNVKGNILATFGPLVGPVAALSGPVRLELSDIIVLDERAESGSALGRLDRGRVVVEMAEIRKHGAWIRGRGHFDPSSELRHDPIGDGDRSVDRHGEEVFAEITSEGLTLQKIDLLRATEPDLEGPLSLSLSLSGPRALVTGTITASLPEIRAGALSLRGGEARGNIHGGKTTVKGSFLGGSLSVEGAVELARRLPYRATLSVDELDVPRIIAALDGHSRWKGKVTGKAELEGTLGDWHLSSGEIHLEHAELDTGSVVLGTAAPARLSMRRGVLETKRLSLAGPMTRLSLEGAFGARTLDLRVAGRVDLGLAEAISPMIERAGGALQLDGVIGGSPDNLNLVGTGRIEGGILQWRGFDSRLTGFNAELTFSQTTILIERAEGRWAGGTLGLTGSVLLGWVSQGKYAPRSVALEVLLDHVRPKLTVPKVDLAGALTGRLEIAGPESGLYAVRGEVAIERGSARFKVDWQNFTERSERISPKVYDPAQELLDVDVAFYSEDPFRVKNDTADVELSLIKRGGAGELRLTGTNQRIGMLGTVNVLRGRVSVVGGREYEMGDGVVEFQEKYRISPRYDLSLKATACASRISIHVVGSLDQPPDTTYRSQPEMDEPNILSCLLRGAPLKDLDSDLGSFAGAAIWKLFGVDRQVKKVLPIDQIDVSTEYSSQARAYEPRVLVAKEVLEGKIRLEYSSSLVKNKDQRAAVRYRITPALTLQSGWTSSEDVPVGDLGLDLKYRWEW